MMMDKEIRKSNGQVTSNDRHISGYAVRFNEQSENLGFYEVITPEAITQELLDECDVFALLDHDPKDVLARSKRGVGNLTLTVDGYGVKYDFDALENTLGDTVLSYVRSGIIDSSSFAFSVAEDGDKWERRDGNVYRTITKIHALYDVSPVYNPAYSTTTCNCRSYEQFIENEQNAEDLKKMIEEIEKM